MLNLLKAWTGVCGGLLILSGVIFSDALADREGMSDDFEIAPLDQTRWSLRRMHQKRHWIEREVTRRGQGALAIRVQGNDFDKDCLCQQNEVREAPARRLNFGDDAWYAFSIRVRGNPALTGKQRWVIGGWKQETGGSAFLAQRYDRGVFHITIESSRTRVLLASGEENAKGFLDRLSEGISSGFTFIGEAERYKGTTDLTFAYGDDPILPDPGADWVDMVYRVRGGLNGTGLVEVYANGKFVVRAEGTIGVQEMAGPTQYFKMGHNRAPMPGVATLYLDNFRRGATREAIEQPNRQN